MLINILNAGQTVRRDARRRLWVTTGVPLVVAPDTTLTLFAHRIGNEDEDAYVMHYLLRGRGGAFAATDRLRVTAWTRVDQVCPQIMAMLPRAVRFDSYPRPAALLMEFLMPEAVLEGLRIGLK